MLTNGLNIYLLQIVLVKTAIEFLKSLDPDLGYFYKLKIVRVG